MQQEFRSAEREQKSLLAAVEKKTLVWLAERMPRAVNSDHLTLLGLASLLLAGISYALARTDPRALLLVVVWLAVNWFGDSLDGTLARVRRTPRPRYGFYVDHVVDTFGALFLLGGLGLSGYMSPLLAAGALAAYYILSIEVYLATYCIGTFHMSFAGIGPTELRILLAIGNVWLYAHAPAPTIRVLGRDLMLLDVGGAIAIGGMLVLAVAASLRHTRMLYRAEPLRPPPSSCLP